MKLLMALLVVGSAAQAEVVCRDYRMDGNIRITHLCADQVSDGVYQNPRLVGDGEWSIAPGINPENRASRMCRVFEGTRQVVSYRLVTGSSEQSKLNLAACYAFRGKFGDFEQFDQIVCH